MSKFVKMICFEDRPPSHWKSEFRLVAPSFRTPWTTPPWKLGGGSSGGPITALDLDENRCNRHCFSRASSLSRIRPDPGRPERKVVGVEHLTSVLFAPRARFYICKSFHPETGVESGHKLTLTYPSAPPSGWNA